MVIRIRDPWAGALLLTLALTALFGVLQHRDQRDLAECRAHADLEARIAAERIEALSRDLTMCTVDVRRSPAVEL